jgi:hypothetical protein
VPQVQLARSGIVAPWGPPSVSMLQFAEACDDPARWSPRTGAWHLRNMLATIVIGSRREFDGALTRPKSSLVN